MKFNRGDYATESERFWAKVAKTEGGCWEWLATKDGRRYGMFAINRREGRKSHMMRSHRYSLEVKIGRFLEKNEEACHTCDNTSCVNPDHLFVGSHDDNMKDMASKGNYNGDNHNAAKVNTDQIEYAVSLRKQGVKLKKIGEIIGLDESHVSRITRGLRKTSRDIDFCP